MTQSVPFAPKAMGATADGGPAAPGSVRPARRRALELAAVGLSAALFLALFADVLLRDRNFIFRDAGHFYYPYFKRIAQEWSAGRIPLWNPYENGGEPLLANPTASVLYPPKLLFVLPYPVAYKWYLLGHVVLAWGTCLAAARGFGAGTLGAVFAATAYAFSGFVVFQLYNIVFLCGAAWLPLAVLAVDRLVRTGATGWMVLLAAVLALQVLAGDPQLAFLVVLAALPYHLVYHHGPRHGLVLIAAALGIGCALRHGFPAGSRAFELLRLRLALGPLPERLNATALGTALYAGTILTIVVGSVWVLLRFRRALLAGAPGRLLGRLVGAGALALALSAAQVLPTIELVRASDRAAPEAPHETVAFSFVPLRLVELLAPAFFGRQFPINTRWAPFERIETGIWIPNAYMGLGTVVFAAAGAWSMRRSAWGLWLVGLTVLMLWLAFGKWGGLWWVFDPHLQQPYNAIRDAGKLSQYGHSDGIYRLLEETVPGFRSFRFPSKALVFPTLGLALLAGIGFERTLQGPTRRLRLGLLVLANIALASLCLAQPWIERWLSAGGRQAGIFGPYHVVWAQRHFLTSVAHFVAAAVLLWLLLLVKDRFGPRARGPIALVLLAGLGIDLLCAHRWLMMTDEQAVLDRKPKVLEAIEANAALDNSGPYRIHRTRIYSPERWSLYADRNRDVELTRWERDTIQPKYGLPFDCYYTTTTGTMSIYDVEFFFAPWVVPTPEGLRRHAPNAPEQLVYYPRQGYNMWNTRYFVLPKLAKLDDEDRGTFTFLATADGRPCPVVAESPADLDDYLVLKNAEAFPRAWVVHSAEFLEPIRGLSRKDRFEPMERLLYRARDAGLALWKGTAWGEYPLRSAALLETSEPRTLAPYVTGQPTDPSETVVIDEYAADRVRMTVRMQTPGFVVLADTFFPGWSATLDDAEPAPIIKANRAMRAVPVPAGTHVIEMRYRSLPFEIGAACSLAAWLGVLGWTTVAAVRRLRSPGPARSAP